MNGKEKGNERERISPYKDCLGHRGAERWREGRGEVEGGEGQEDEDGDGGLGEGREGEG